MKNKIMYIFKIHLYVKIQSQKKWIKIGWQMKFQF
jgi:hypothetical protein